jgi:hypothetical protein
MVLNTEALPFVSCCGEEPDMPRGWIALYLDKNRDCLAAKATTIWGEFPELKVNPGKEDEGA